MCRRAAAVVGAAWLVLSAVDARADLVFLSGGRSLSVKAYRVEGDRAVLTLRGGGELVCDAGLITRVTPDEVPYPEPAQGTASPPAPPAADPRYAGIIDSLALQHSVDASLVRAVIEVESGYRADARSHKGAMGLMQLMPATARRYAVADPYDPRENLEAGIRHLRSLLDRYDVRLALAAYNAGEGAVVRFGGVPPYEETRAYVARVLQRAGLPGRDERAGRAGPRRSTTGRPRAES